MDIKFIRLDIHSSFTCYTVRHTNTQRSLQTHSRKFQTQVTPFLSALSNSLSLSHSFIKQIRGPNLKQIHSHCAEGTLNAVLNAIRSILNAVRSSPCRRYSPFLLNPFSFLLLRFLCVSFSNFRFWNFMILT